MGRSATVSIKMNRDMFPERCVFDRISIGGWDFDICITVRNRFGRASALQGGCVIYLEMYQSGEPVALYDHGKWDIPLNKENDEAAIALSYFLEKHNRKHQKKE